MSDAPLSEEDAETIQGEWLRRVEAEYRSAAVTQQLTLWLMQLVAPLELVRSGLVIAEDELVHSELSYRVHSAAGGTSLANLRPETIGMPTPAPGRLLEAIVVVGTESFCLGETVAVRLFSRLRQPCTQADARVALDRILKDEVRHKEFGWTLLEWLLTTPRGPEVKAIAARALPAALERLRRNYAHDALGQTPEATPVQAAWGLMPPSEYASVLEETLRKDYVPLFGDFGIDVQRAWDAG